MDEHWGHKEARVSKLFKESLASKLAGYYDDSEEEFKISKGKHCTLLILLGKEQKRTLQHLRQQLEWIPTGVMRKSWKSQKGNIPNSNCQLQGFLRILGEGGGRRKWKG